MNLGLRSRILLIASLLVLLASGAIAVVSSYFFNQRMADAYASRSHAIAQGLAVQLDRILALGIRITELQGFEEQCLEAVRANHGLSYAMVALSDGQILFHSDPRRMRTKVESQALIDALGRGYGALDDAFDRSHAALASVREQGTDQIATIVVGFPLEMVSAERRSLMRLTIVIGLIATLAALILLYFALSQQVTRPLSRLVHDIEAMRSGTRGYSERLAAHRDDELGVMVQGFNGLLDRIAEREADLVAARDAAEAASKAKSQFLAVISHEIRTPMNAVLGMTELLLGTDLTDRQRLFASRSLTAGRSLMVLLNDILDFSRIESGRLEIVVDAFDLRAVVQETVELFSEMAARKSLDLRLTVDPTLPERCRGDYVRIAQVLRNLVSNAVKFTARGVVQVTVMPMGERIRFSVSDTGIGIEPAFMGHLYEAFTQADASSTRRFGGLGLGLAIVKSLTDRLGGEVGLQSTVGRGSTFWVDLPLPAVEDAVTRPTQTIAANDVGIAGDEADDSAGNGSGRRQLLLVEDNPENQDLVCAMLEGEPWDVVLADNGDLAVSLVRRTRFDAVLMDWAIPGLDGVQATRAMREYEHEQRRVRTPIIAATARVMAGDREACLRAGMDDYLAKPFERTDLVAMLARWVPVRTGKIDAAA